MKLSYDEAAQRTEEPRGAAEPITRIDDPGQLPPDVEQTGSGFFDPDNTGAELGTIRLRRILRDGKETFLLDSRIGYRDKELGVFLVPNPSKPFTTDLASVPQVFTWLVPKSGEHLPAALLHDGLVPPWQKTYIGPEISRQQADRIFRNAMRDLGTGWIRRWLIWTAVVFATEAEAGFSHGAWKTARGLRILGRLVVFIGIILMLGIMATIDLFDHAELVPWMGDQSTAYELLAGGLFAVIVPAVLSLLFWRRGMVRAALILGIAMALFLHVTVVVSVLLLTYNGVEAAISATRGRAGWKPVVAGFSVLGAMILGLLVLLKSALAIPEDWVDWRFHVSALQEIADALGRLGAWLWDLPGWLYLFPLAACLWLFIELTRRPSESTPVYQNEGTAY